MPDLGLPDHGLVGRVRGDRAGRGQHQAAAVGGEHLSALAGAVLRVVQSLEDRKRVNAECEVCNAQCGVRALPAGGRRRRGDGSPEHLYRGELLDQHGHALRIAAIAVGGVGMLSCSAAARRSIATVMTRVPGG